MPRRTRAESRVDALVERGLERGVRWEGDRNDGLVGRVRMAHDAPAPELNEMKSSIKVGVVDH